MCQKSVIVDLLALNIIFLHYCKKAGKNYKCQSITWMDKEFRIFLDATTAVTYQICCTTVGCKLF